MPAPLAPGLTAPASRIEVEDAAFLDEGVAELCRRHLHDFVLEAWPIVEPARALIDNWHVSAICDHLEAVARGEIQKLLITIPPGHAKSILIAVMWPAWQWAHRPSWRSIFASYSESLALRDSIRCRALIESPWYRAAFMAPSEWSLASDQNTKHVYGNTESGFRLSTSVGGASTGHRGDAVVVDDPLKADDAYSKLAQENAIFWWDVAMSQRLNDPQRGARVIVQQRLHENDLAGHVLRQGGYEHLNLPSEYDPSARAVTYHLVDVPANGAPAHRKKELFFEDKRSEPGELLFPQAFTAEVLAEAKRVLREDGYAAQHGQRPTPAGGGMFKRAWWRFWKPDGTAPDQQEARPIGCFDGPARPLPAEFDRQIISLDANFKDRKSSDAASIGVWGTKGADRFLLHRVHAHGFLETLNALRRVVELFPDAHKKLIELKANGDAIVDTLRSEIGGLVGVEPLGGKEARAWAIQPEVQGANCYLPDGAPWVGEYIAEFDAFPKGAHDDDVDMTSQALMELSQRPTTADLWSRAEF